MKKTQTGYLRGRRSLSTCTEARIGKKTLTVTFEVNDDLTSERVADYRGAMVEAMSKYLESVQGAIHEIGLEQMDPDALVNVGLIDQMLNDCNR